MVHCTQPREGKNGQRGALKLPLCVEGKPQGSIVRSLTLHFHREGKNGQRGALKLPLCAGSEEEPDRKVLLYALHNITLHFHREGTKANFRIEAFLNLFVL